MTIFNDHFFEGAGGQRNIKDKIIEVAANRGWWFQVVGAVRFRWRRLREGHENGRAHGSLKKKNMFTQGSENACIQGYIAMDLVQDTWWDKIQHLSYNMSPKLLAYP